ncbi:MULTISPECIES: formyltransferase family protein [Photorhabdus]|uniref:formyltransferase family protein n=1 Tax=Photorhabdus TaxID=29487 RepID=UPI0007B4AFC4|nr:MULTISPECIES: formyltransferase family protein [Photorhabdus]AXG43227.1 hypothetical protein PluDJC_13870 [Photorhabdus laumondii subsp. laumondii]MCC8390507.1 hypothetical protein [Photorhabdus laumondii]MCZ1247688.1 hypothetical protein [Photorhabdus laumondii subsp. laumondii]NDL18882.1 hypothetical protein [Photorhabdus laumondii subsp. laumondii]NDL50800.1 hypothetical protein [Photorhabdus laumondii subsp. laumondii]
MPGEFTSLTQEKKNSTDNTLTNNTLPNNTLKVKKCKIVNHPTGEARSCVVIGGTTLAIRCTQQLQAAGYIIVAIFPTESLFSEWATSQNIHCVEAREDLLTLSKTQSICWLFSIVNPVILPALLINQFSQGAFNYHDAPLPRYAGTHATSWAILAGESQYAITWHLIGSMVDSGDIVVQRHVDIKNTDTALSLNLKCYQAAIEGFTELLNNLENGDIPRRQQDPDNRSFFSRRRRPDAAGCLLWNKKAQELSSLVRSLTFGVYYPNPLTLPKVLLRDRLVAIGTLQVMYTRSDHKPGTLLGISEDHWLMTTSSEDIRISFVNSRGNPINALILANQCKLEIGDQLPTIARSDIKTLTDIHEQLTEQELFWQKRLARFSTPMLPFRLRATIDKIPDWHMSEWKRVLNHSSLISTELVQHIICAWFIYLAHTSNDTQFQVGWAQAEDAVHSSKWSSFFAMIIPMEIHIDLQQRLTEILNSISSEQQLLEKNRVYPCDMVSRQPVLRAINPLHNNRPWPIGISVIADYSEDITNKNAIQEHAIVGEIMTLQIDKNKGNFRFIYNSKLVAVNNIEHVASDLVLFSNVIADSKNLNIVANELPIYEFSR